MAKDPLIGPPTEIHSDDVSVSMPQKSDISIGKLEKSSCSVSL